MRAHQNNHERRRPLRFIVPYLPPSMGGCDYAFGPLRGRLEPARARRAEPIGNDVQCECNEPAGFCIAPFDDTCVVNRFRVVIEKKSDIEEPSQTTLEPMLREMQA